MQENAATRILILVGGVAFILLGIYRKEVAEVLKKSITICLECIGIG
ncbi:MAG: thioredoxin [Clostridiales bacterium]|nr:thioredoxin [Clostridiales bacterium]